MRPDRLNLFNSSLFVTYQEALANFKNENEAHHYVRRALIQYLQDGDAKYFPLDEVKKEFTSNFTREEVARELADYLYQHMQNNSATTRMEKRLNLDLFNLEMEGKNEAQILSHMRDCLLGKSDKFKDIGTDYLRNMAARVYETNEVGRMIQEQKRYEAQLARQSNERYGVTNVRVNRNALNLCRDEVVRGAQISIQNGIYENNARNGRIIQRPRRDYTIDDELFAVTDIGNARQNQEDSVLILTHPSNPKYKMLVVADGMGGHASGEKASYETVREMVDWFESINPQFFSDDKRDELAKMWSEKLQDIDEAIDSKFHGAGTTFVGAIVGDTSTLIASVGDSRAYMVDNNYELRQMTVDDNLDYRDWERKWGAVYVKSRSGKTKATIEKMLDEKDKVRFSVNSNVIMECVGLGEGVEPRFVTLPNTAYRTLMLFSDGVTDCLSDSQIMAITRSTKPSDLARAVVDMAITNVSKRPDLADNPKYRTTIVGGKDNATAAVYSRNKGGEER